MKKTILIIVILMLAAVLLPTQTFAYTDINVTGNWTCEYEINDYGVGASGGTAVLRLKVKNTAASSSTDIIHYVSVTYGVGSVSEFYENKSVTIAPTRDQILEYYIPIDAADAGRPNTLWVAMSIGDEDDVDGIGAKTGIVFGPEPTYDASFEISTSTTTINQGDTVKIAYGGSNTGNQLVDIEVYDQYGTLLMNTENMDILFLGSKNYAPEHTTTYRFTCKVYNAATDALVKEVLSSPLTITVIEPTPEPAAEEPAEESTADPAAEEPTEEPAEATPQPDMGTEVEVNEQSTEAPVVLSQNQEDANDSYDNSSNILWIMMIVLLFVITFAIIGIVIYLIKTNTKS